MKLWTASASDDCRYSGRFGDYVPIKLGHNRYEVVLERNGELVRIVGIAQSETEIADLIRECELG